VVTLVALGMILGAAYSLWLYNHVIFRNFKPKFLQIFFDLNKRKVLIFLPFVVEIIWMVVYL
jgi:NADH-ubiquinone oxidoreductase chain 4